MSKKIIMLGEDRVFLESVRDSLVAEGKRCDILFGIEELKTLLDTVTEGHDILCVMSEQSVGNNNADFLLRRIRSSSLSGIPIILMANPLDHESAMRLIKNGVDGILCKPFEVKAALEAVERAIKRRDEIEINKFLKANKLC